MCKPVFELCYVCLYLCGACVFVCVCVEIMEMSSGYEEMYMLFGGDGMSCMNRLKSVGLSTEPCGTPFGKFLVLDDSPL